MDTFPSGVHPDEATLAYNAYSILETGKDEHGIFLPFIIQSFGDQKSPAYVYSLIPSISAFGLNNFALRLPAAVIGTLLVLSIFLLLKEFGFSNGVSYIGALITAVSPWQIILSRLFGYESNIGLLFFVLGLLFALVAYKKDSKLYYILFGIFFGLTWYGYVAFRLVTPVMLLGFVLIYMRRKKLLEINRILLLVSFFFVVSPLILATFFGKANARFGQTSSIPNQGAVMEINENRYYCNKSLPKLFCEVDFNKAFEYSQNYLSRYMYSYSPDYLFISGDKEALFFNVKGFGLFPILLLPFYLFGLGYLWNRITSKTLSKNEAFLIVGLLISPLPAVLVDIPHKIRLSALFPFSLILIIYGVFQISNYLKKKNYKIIYFAGLISALFIFSIVFMVNFLVVHMNKYEALYGGYISELMTYLGGQDKKTEVYISSINEAVEFYVYVNKVAPALYQRNAIYEKPNDIGYSLPTDFENIHTTKSSIEQIYCKSKGNKNHVFYVTKEDFQEKLGKATKIFTSNNGAFKLAFVYDMKYIHNKNIDCKVITESQHNAQR